MPVKNPEEWMWQRARAMLDQADRMQLQVFYRSGRPRRAAWVPPADAFETATEVWIVVALPGVARETIEIVCAGERVHISGERRLPQGFGGAAVRRLEIPIGRFERELELPCACAQVLRTELEDGLFFLALAKK